jgi:hypothetical protein
MGAYDEDTLSGNTTNTFREGDLILNHNLQLDRVVSTSKDSRGLVWSCWTERGEEYLGQDKNQLVNLSKSKSLHEVEGTDLINRLDKFFEDVNIERDKNSKGNL